MNIKNIDQNSLEELMALINQIKKRVNDYSHVTEYLPKTLTKQINDFSEKLNNEYDNRID
jgi:hypothetical protein